MLAVLLKARWFTVALSLMYQGINKYCRLNELLIVYIRNNLVCLYLRYFCYSDLVIIDRKKLKDCKDSEKSPNIKGMIVIDDEQEGCKEGFNDMFKFECYRPSYRTSDIT